MPDLREKPPLFHNYRQAVVATLAFFDLFDQPLTLEEIETYLLQWSPERHPLKITLQETQRIQKKGPYHALREIGALIQEYEKRQRISKQWWQKVHRFQWIFELIPYIRGVSVCNTLATDNANETSDIDLLVITDPKRLFLSRLCLTLALHLLGVRRHGKKIARRFCLSFFITTEQLDLKAIQKGPYDIYLAYWLRTLKPVVGPKALHETILHTNQSWLKAFFSKPNEPNWSHWKPASSWKKALQRLQEKGFNTRWGDWMEDKLANWQLKRARKKQLRLGLSPEDSAIVLHRHMLKFHNVDQRENLYHQWKEKISA